MIAADTPPHRRTLPTLTLHPVLLGAIWGLGFMIVISLLAGPVLSRDRATKVSLDAIQSGAIPDPFAHRIEDYYTECSLLTTLIARSTNPVTNAIATWLPAAATKYRHPCEGLQSLAEGRDSRVIPPGLPPYANYPFGPRYLEAIALSVLSYSAASDLYLVLSYASILLLAAAAFWNNRRMALLTAPLYLGLLFGFAMHLFGQNLAHAPGFFVGFVILAYLLASKTRFGRVESRLALYVALALAMSYFDMLNGPLLVMLALSMVLTQLFYLHDTFPADDGATKAYARSVAIEAGTIVACFAGAYLFVTVTHLALLTLINGHALETYRHGLSVRLGSDVGVGHVGFWDVMSRLWIFRDDLVPTGGYGLASWFLYASVAAWLLALMTAYLDTHSGGMRLWCDGGVMLLATAGVFAWYVLFLNHTYVHAQFDVRYLALPASFGFVALLLVLDAVPVRHMPKTQRWLLPGAAAVALVMPAFALHNAWASTRGDYRIEAQRRGDGADLVSCGNAAQGLRADSKPDALVELTLKGATPPLALLHIRAKPTRPDVKTLQLIRDTPNGNWATVGGGNILGVSKAANGPLINTGNGAVSLANPGTYYLHYCADGQDEPMSKYQLTVDGQAVEVH